MLRAHRDEFVQGARGVEGLVLVGIGGAGVALQRAQLRGDGLAVELGRRQARHALGGVDDRTVARAAAQVAGQGVVDLAAARLAAFLLQVQAPQRHRESGRTEAALRTVALDQRLLHGVQRAILLRQVFDGEQGLAVQRGGELDAGIHGPHLQFAVFERSEHDGAGAAVAFGAAFLGAGAVQVLAQVLQDGLRRRDVVHFMDGAAVEKSDRCGHHCLGLETTVRMVLTGWKSSTGGRAGYIQIPILNIRYFQYRSPHANGIAVQHAHHRAGAQCCPIDTERGRVAKLAMLEPSPAAQTERIWHCTSFISSDRSTRIPHVRCATCACRPCRAARARSNCTCRPKAAT